nr:hypothetical protein [Phyllobacterium brassicacearum]
MAKGYAANFQLRPDLVVQVRLLLREQIGLAVLVAQQLLAAEQV